MNLWRWLLGREDRTYRQQLDRWASMPSEIRPLSLPPIRDLKAQSETPETAAERARARAQRAVLPFSEKRR